MVYQRGLVGLLSAFAIAGLPACGKKKSSASGVSANLPLISPPVKAATPAGLQSGSNLDLSLPAADFKTRFFITGTGSGPTDIFNILASIDDRIAGLNTQTAGISPPLPCLAQAPVAFTITPFGQPVTMYAQCYGTVTGPNGSSGFIQFGVKDGVTYVYETIGIRTAIIAKPGPGAASSTNYAVQAWLGLGDNNNNKTWDSASYGLMEISADPSTSTIEFTAAGTGFGYCGVQMRTDGKTIYATGSQDQGGCQPIDTICVAATDASTGATCGATVTTFNQPAIGREAGQGAGTVPASKYPATPNVLLNGTPTDALAFGPATPTAGVGVISAAQ